MKIGFPADVTIFDPDKEWIVNPNQFISKGKNTPLEGLKLKGQVLATLVDGEIVYSQIEDNIVSLTAESM